MGDCGVPQYLVQFALQSGDDSQNYFFIVCLDVITWPLIISVYYGIVKAAFQFSR